MQAPVATIVDVALPMPAATVAVHIYENEPDTFCLATRMLALVVFSTLRLMIVMSSFGTSISYASELEALFLHSKDFAPVTLEGTVAVHIRVKVLYGAMSSMFTDPGSTVTMTLKAVGKKRGNAHT